MFNAHLIYLIVGVVYAIISLLFGGFPDGLHFGFDFDFNLFALPLKSDSLIAFLVVFGGVGLTSLKSLSPLHSLIPSVALVKNVAGNAYTSKNIENNERA